ncbi:hypothetical protein DMN91_007389 [Ooceraea biroi]|uniref:Retrovirus-related Pol polyprotein from transposon TNT 1-94-like beta-barrel domain-containing protein n=1 Tax=Ooceraea biroi TaxID=2015173 RepID=A0A3L8DK01_OOCBI|nr:hypothetical protein DMN91_007389 [Ooceraea biroi]
MATEIKVQVDKLESEAEWARWKWQMSMLFEQYDLVSIVDGTRRCPSQPPTIATADVVKEFKVWKSDNGRAANYIMSALNKQNAELVLSCTTAHECWQKLCSRFERSSTQRRDMLFQQFFKAEHNKIVDVASYIARIQKIFIDHNSELQKQHSNTLDESVLLGRITSSLGTEYNEFQNVWEVIPEEQQTINLLTEKLCAIELRNRSTIVSQSEAVAFEAKSTAGKKNNDLQARNKRIQALKQKTKCAICHVKGHWAKECQQNKNPQHISDGSKKNTNNSGHKSEQISFSIDVEAGSIDSWICDSGASQHMTANKQYFVSYEKFAAPVPIKVANKQTILAYGKGRVNIELFINSRWRRSHIKDVCSIIKQLQLENGITERM